MLGRADGGWTPLASRRQPIAPGSTHRLRVTALGASIKVYVDDMATPKISVTDGTYGSGTTVLRLFGTAVTFDNVAVSPAR